MFCSESLEMLSFVFRCSNGCSEDDEALFLLGELTVANPHFWSETGDVLGLVSGCVPYSGFPTVEPDVGMGFEVVRQLVVDGPDSVGWADSVHIVQECKKGFSFLEVGLDSFQGSSLP